MTILPLRNLRDRNKSLRILNLWILKFNVASNHIKSCGSSDAPAPLPRLFIEYSVFSETDSGQEPPSFRNPHFGSMPEFRFTKNAVSQECRDAPQVRPPYHLSIFQEPIFGIIKQLEIPLHIFKLPPVAYIHRIMVKIIDLCILHREHEW